MSQKKIHHTVVNFLLMLQIQMLQFFACLAKGARAKFQLEPAATKVEKLEQMVEH